MPDKIPRAKKRRDKPGRIPPAMSSPSPPLPHNGGSPVLCFRFADRSKYRVYDWTHQELMSLFRFFDKLEAVSWSTVIQTGGPPGNKVGLGYTPFDKPPAKLPQNISPDVSIFELRVDGKRRVFAFRQGDACNLVWFDRNHVLAGKWGGHSDPSVTASPKTARLVGVSAPVTPKPGP